VHILHYAVIGYSKSFPTCDFHEMESVEMLKKVGELLITTDAKPNRLRI